MAKALFTNIAFIGGIHGVGKTTICNAICNATELVYLSASQVLKWNEINQDDTNKTVSDVTNTQGRLVRGLTGIVDKRNKYLLDGHYCLLDKESVIQKIPSEIFIKINPFSLNLIVEDVSLIKERLEKRDGKPYDFDLLERLQSNEVAHAMEVSNILNTQLNIGSSQDISDITSHLKQPL